MKRLPLFLTLLLLQAGNLAASEVSIVAGTGTSSDLERSEEGSGIPTEFDSSGLFGVRYEKDFLLILGFENNLIFARDLLTPKGGPGESGFYYTGNLVFNFPVDRIVPNIVVGLGLLHRGGDSYPDAGTSFLTNWGFGVKLRQLAGPVGFRADYRRIGIHGVEDETVTEQEFSGGLLITF